VWDSKESTFVHKRKEMGGAFRKYGERCVEVLVSKPDGKRLLGRLRCKWRDNKIWLFMEWNGDVK
jgi:hypothetical protein